MDKQTLHITNGSVLTERLNELDFDGDFLTWHEMLSEGPTTEQIDTELFIEIRSNFINQVYGLEIDEKEFKSEIDKLNHSENYKDIVLWFEFDLFCHINLVAVISLISQKHINLPIYLVCSGRVKGEKDLKGIAELTTGQLLSHYKNNVLLTSEDIDMATTIWGIYCGKNHNLLKPFIVKSSSFEYLSNCLKAHLKRFPDSKSGLSILEEHILKTIDQNDVKSKHHLLGYILNYQGYYGYGDLQLKRMINALDIFYKEGKNKLKLNKKGNEAISAKKNFSNVLKNVTIFGGIRRNDFQFDKELNKLIEINNAH
ncbi:MAG: DUF1835 domain-containing protein [Flavobacteriaceae bacterium]|nr:DUF1835 domain-containing protein [Flavobacteriaceae bacterium]